MFLALRNPYAQPDQKHHNITISHHGLGAKHKSPQQTHSRVCEDSLKSKRVYLQLRALSVRKALMVPQVPPPPARVLPPYDGASLHLDVIHPQKPYQTKEKNQKHACVVVNRQHLCNGRPPPLPRPLHACSRLA